MWSFFKEVEISLKNTQRFNVRQYDNYPINLLAFSCKINARSYSMSTILFGDLVSYRRDLHPNTEWSTNKLSTWSTRRKKPHSILQSGSNRTTSGSWRYWARDPRRHEAIIMHINGCKDGEEFDAFSLSLTFAQWLMRLVAQAPF